MTMAMLEPGKKPRVEEYKGSIAVWAGSGGDDATGLVLSTGAAYDTGIAMLALASKMRGEPVPTLAGSIEVETAHPTNEEFAARLILDIEGVRFAIPFSAIQFTELAAGVSAIAREIG